jgi:hypothetical protein
VSAFTDLLEKERVGNKGLAGHIAVMEGNSARLGFDPEEMHKAILKPERTVSRAGAGGTQGFSQAVAYDRAAQQSLLHNNHYLPGRATLC